MTKHRHSTSLFLLALTIVILTLSGTTVQAQEKNVRIIFTLQIYDIDRFSRTANVNVTLTFENLTGQQVAEKEPLRAILIGGANILEISCNKTLSGDYMGSSGPTVWSLSGPLARGEYFPFDEGQLLFQIANVLPGPFNISEAEIDSNKSFAYFDGPGKSMLNETYVASGNAYIVDAYFEENLKATIQLKRRADAYLMDRSFWLLIVPTLASYYVLACSLFLWSRDSLSNRLRVYVAIFIFSPTFMMAMQGQLPFRVTLAIPEVLLVNLMISTAILSIFSVLPLGSENWKASTRDGVASFLSVYVTVYLFVVLTPVFPVKALPVFVTVLLSYGLSTCIVIGKTIGFLGARYRIPRARLRDILRVRWIINRIRHPRTRAFVSRVVGVFAVYVGFWFILGRLLGDERTFWAGVLEVMLGLILLLLPERLLRPTENVRPFSRGEDGSHFVGSKKSRVYHRLSCSHARIISRENRIWFKDSADAEKNRRNPCRVCIPV